MGHPARSVELTGQQLAEFPEHETFERYWVHLVSCPFVTVYPFAADHGHIGGGGNGGGGVGGGGAGEALGP